MAEYNGVTLEPLTDGSQDRDYQVEQFILLGGRSVRQHWHYPLNSAVSLCAPMLRTW